MRDRDKQDQLARTWGLMADAVERALRAETPSAATLAAANKWLDANGVTFEILKSWRRNGLGFTGPLPTFDDDPIEGTEETATSDPLRVVPSFVASDSNG
ncbi:hypothetical protein [Reyranella sp.]|uniref:hypothetical protein n=1 Tax=Reyranella sp. TaxID=1929291 RepID=UPI0012271A2C|nr:hypothetical protein [Reyranella sp.]TAJ89445.1 MAG: hypothetical protein EPO50_03505 [Reyranella sp.]